MINKYPYTDFNEYNLDWCIKRIRDLSDEWASTHQEWLEVQHSWEEVQTEWENYKKYIDEYFENLDLSQEVSDKINEMAEDGYFADLFVSLFRSDIIASAIDTAGTYTAGWIADNLMQEVGYVIDSSLTVQNAAADAKATGDAIKVVDDDLARLYVVGDETSFSNYGQGYIDPDTGANATSSYYVRTLGYMHFADAFTIFVTMDATHKGYFIEYETESPSSFVQSFEVVNGETTRIPLTSDHCYRLTLSEVPERINTDPADIPATAATYHTVKTTDNTLTMPMKAADAKAVGDILNAFKTENRIDNEWQQKTINSTSGAETANSTRISTINFINTDYLPLKVTCDLGYKYSFRYYSAENTTAIIGSTDWLTGENVPALETGQFLKVVVSNSTNTVIEPEEGIHLYVTYESYTDKSLSKADKAADAKAVGDRFADFENNYGSSLIARNDKQRTILKLLELNTIPRTGSNTYGNKPLCFLHFSDIHNDKKRLENVIEYANYYGDLLDDVIHTGDTVYYTSEDGISAWEDVTGAENILNTIGNHDSRYNDVWKGLTEAECYTKYIYPFISNWNVSSYTPDHCYYYKDYEDEEVRLIVLDYMHQTAEQLTWFSNTLSDARTNSLDVVVAVHARAHWDYDSYEIPWDDKPVVAAYQAGFSDSSADSYPQNLSDDYADAVDSFITAGGKFVCWIHGHTHYKMFAQLHTHPDQLDVAVCNAGIRPFAQTYVNSRIDGTVSEDSFNIVAIDTTSKVLKIIAVGAVYDRYMRVVDSVSYNYDTHELLYSNDR